MWEWKGLHRATFSYHKMVQVCNRKGLLRASFNYNKLCKHEGWERSTSSQPLLPWKLGNGGGKELSRAIFCYHKMVEIGEGKGLPRATFNYDTFSINMGRKGTASSHLSKGKGCLEPPSIAIYFV